MNETRELERKEADEPGNFTGSPRGCSTCMDDDPVMAACEASRFRPVATIEDDSNYSVRVVRCWECGQAFLKVCTDSSYGGYDGVCIVDWMPLKECEVEYVLAQEPGFDTRKLSFWSVGRRVLRSGGGRPRWTTSGICIMAPF